MAEDCDHDFRVISGRTKGNGALTTAVTMECEKCGGLKDEKREKLE